MVNDVPVMVKIERIEKETDNTQTYYLKHKLSAKPGQFVMLWIPEVDQKPMSISYLDRKGFGVTVACVGDFTRKLCHMPEGGMVGFSGPYGRGFSADKKNVVLVGGGCGSAPLAFLAEELSKAGCEVTVIIGARSEKNILFRERLSGNNKLDVIFCTDDGSFGEKGLAPDVLKKILKGKDVEKAYTCGPELMMKEVFDICSKKGVEVEASLERYMKCGIGLCGSCCIDDQLVCKDGPVFNSSQLRQLTEFGKFGRDKTGRKIFLSKY